MTPSASLPTPPPPPSSREYQIGVDIRRGRQQYQNTRVVTFVARYQLENRTGYTLAYLQRHQLQDEVKYSSPSFHYPPLPPSVSCPILLSICSRLLPSPLSPFPLSRFFPFAHLSSPPCFLPSYSLPSLSPLLPQSGLFPRSFSTCSRNGYNGIAVNTN